MPFRSFRIAGLLCLTLCTSSVRSGITIVDNPHVYSSSEPEEQTYESEAEELERLELELESLKAVKREHFECRWSGCPKLQADMRDRRIRIRNLKNVLKSYADVGEEHETEAPSDPVRVRFGDGPMEVIK